MVKVCQKKVIITLAPEQPRQLTCLERNVMEDDTSSKLAAAPIAFKGSISAKSAKHRDDNSHQVRASSKTVGKKIIFILKTRYDIMKLRYKFLQRCRCNVRLDPVANPTTFEFIATTYAL
jgi:hypothetical protein